MKYHGSIRESVNRRFKNTWLHEKACVCDYNNGQNKQLTRLATLEIHGLSIYEIKRICHRAYFFIIS